MQTIKEFLARPDIEEIKSHSLGQIIEEDFFRDPLRPVFYNREVLYAPADGIVLYAKEIDADEQYEIKGADFTLKDMLAEPDAKGKYLVVGIFMTALDVHINRVPADCYYLSHRETNAIQTKGVSMIMAENDLLEELKYKKSDLDYLRYNQKMVSSFYSPVIKRKFYIVQVADRDVDVIQCWGARKFLSQCRRFGQIRYGSQCDLVIPLDKKMKYELLVKSLDHVEAGVDPLIRIIKEN